MHAGPTDIRADADVALDLAEANETLALMGADDRIRWAVQAFGYSAALLSSMQRTASVLMHHFHRLGLRNEVLFVDTGYHFRETLELRDRFIRQYGLNLVTLYPDLTPEEQEERYGRKLYQYVDGQPECCRLRKSRPFVSYVRSTGKRLCMVGLRRSEGGRRDGLEPLVRDLRTGGYTLHPIYDWTDTDVTAYLDAHDVPIHDLHAQSYPSIGCACCTTPVAEGEDPRAGRWRHLREHGADGPRYCNILFSDGGGI